MFRSWANSAWNKLYTVLYPKRCCSLHLNHDDRGRSQILKAFPVNDFFPISSGITIMAQITSTIFTALALFFLQLERVRSLELASCKPSAGFSWVSRFCFLFLSSLICHSRIIHWTKTHAPSPHTSEASATADVRICRFFCWNVWSLIYSFLRIHHPSHQQHSDLLVSFPSHNDKYSFWLML